jgi:predicted dehydrogenase
MLAHHQKDLGLPDDRCFLTYEDMIRSDPKLDAVIVGTPIPEHAPQAVLALDAGIHVMSEVTASNTVEGCTSIVEAAQRSDATYMIAENSAYRPLFRDWEKLVRGGKLGEIIYAEADYIHPIPELLVNAETGEKYWRASRPPIHYCSHSLGPLLYLIKDRVVRAMGVGDTQRILPDVGIGATDIQLGVFETEKGVIIKVTRTQVAPRHNPIHYYHLQGTKGMVETDRRGSGFNGEEMQGGLLYIEGEMEHTKAVEWPEIDSEAPEWATLGGHGTSDYWTFAAFLDALATGKKPVLDEVRGWDMTVPGLVAAKSASQGGDWMDVPAPPVEEWELAIAS